MQAPNENQTNLLSAIHSIFSYYQLLLEKKSKWVFQPEYHSSTVHFVNVFLQLNQYVEFNADGTLENVAAILPNRARLITLIADFSNHYIVNKLALTQVHLKAVAKLPVSADKKRKFRSEISFSTSPTFVAGFFILEKESKQGDLKGHAGKKTTDHFPQYEMKNNKAIRMCNWDEAEFAGSVRSLYNFYCSHEPSRYTLKELVTVVKFERFTTGSGRQTVADVLYKFNNFLSRYNFITQIDKNIKTINVTAEPFPEQDERLKNLFKQFKNDFYLRRFPTTVSAADPQSPVANSVASIAPRVQISAEYQENSLVALPESAPGYGPQYDMKLFEFHTDRLDPQQTVRIVDWSESEFVKSIRLLYDCYRCHKHKFYTRKDLYSIAKLEQFTSAVNERTEADILRTFNKFLIQNELITQKNSILKSIEVTEKPFPEDEKLVNLFIQFKRPKYKKQSAEVAVPDFQRHHAKPAAAKIANRADLRFILNSDKDPEDYFLPICSMGI
jgi:hypothetical protein